MSIYQDLLLFLEIYFREKNSKKNKSILGVVLVLYPKKSRTKSVDTDM